MNSNALSVNEYLNELPDSQQGAVQRIYQLALERLPKGFEPIMQYGMISFVVPLSLYPHGYHVRKGTPLPFLAIAAQKNYISVYHLVLYGDLETYNWFTNAYLEHYGKPVDMGKSCLRFKKESDIPFDLLGELFTKWTPAQYIQVYERFLGERLVA